MADHNNTPMHPGDSNGINRRYLDSLLVELRQIDTDLPDTALTLYGHTFSTPIMMAALSHLDNVYPNGMVEMAKGAAQANAVMWAGMGSESELERITATGAKTIKIIKPYAEEEAIFRRLRHAEACGALAVGMDIDHSFARGGAYDVIHGIPMAPKTLSQLKAYKAATSLPFIVKGVLSVRDAQKCMDAGLDGIVVSHHHGIQAYAVPPLQILPQIAEAVGRAFPIFVDCGIDSGMDVYKAMALGATSVSMGRKIMESLRAEGAAGVEASVRSFTAELATTMARTAVTNLSAFDPSVIWHVQ